VIIKPIGPPPVKVNRGEHVKTWFPLTEGLLKRMEEGEAENNLTEFNPLCLKSLNNRKKNFTMVSYIQLRLLNSYMFRPKFENYICVGLQIVGYSNPPPEKKETFEFTPSLRHTQVRPVRQQGAGRTDILITYSH